MAVTARWQFSQWNPAAGDCSCRWNFYSKQCRKGWHQELARPNSDQATVDLPAVPTFTPHRWGRK